MQELELVPSWLRAFHELTKALRVRADSIEVLGEDQRTRLIRDGVPPERITLRRSGSPVSFEGDVAPLERPAMAVGKVLLLYSGAVGHAHDFETFVQGYERHHRVGSARVVLWLNATGARADAFDAALRTRGLPVHRTTGVPLDRLASLLVTADAHLITLRNEFVGLVVPSKVYACIESRRAILFVGSTSSDVHLLCSERCPSGDYLRADVGSPESVERALEALTVRASEAHSESAGRDRRREP
jgi:hypothetical protein